MEKIWSFLRHEAIFSISCALALLSAIAVPPSKNYLNYIDFDTLLILFALMAIISALRSLAFFERLGFVLCQKFNNLRMLSIVLIFTVFFSSMLITNDVALITFVPFTLAFLAKRIKGRFLLLLVVLETIAANTGSMLTPLGNPQNLYLFEQMGLDIWPFIALILPYTAFSALLLIILALFIPRETLAALSDGSLKALTLPQKRQVNIGPFTLTITPKQSEFLYGILFLIALLAVMRLVPKIVAALITLVVLLLIDKKVLKSVDYLLLLTFFFFFIFTGNLAAWPDIKLFLEKVINGHEFLTAVASSQLISNVPATLLLYPFAANKKALLLGVNIGGLGTLVASLASLISYKYYASASHKIALPSRLQYLAAFSALNLFILSALTALFYLLASN